MGAGKTLFTLQASFWETRIIGKRLATGHFAIPGRPKSQNTKIIYVYNTFWSPEKMLAHLTRIFSTKAGSADSGARINERDPGKTCLRLKVGKPLPKPHGPKGAERTRSTCTGRSAKREARGPERRRVGGSEGPPAIRRGGGGAGGVVVWPPPRRGGHLHRPVSQTRGPGPRAPEGRRVGGSPSDPEGGGCYGVGPPRKRKVLRRPTFSSHFEAPCGFGTFFFLLAI